MYKIKNCILDGDNISVELQRFTNPLYVLIVHVKFVCCSLSLQLERISPQILFMYSHVAHSLSK